MHIKIFLLRYTTVPGRQSTTTLGHNDGSSDATDWLIPSALGTEGWLGLAEGRRSILSAAGGGSCLAGFADRQTVRWGSHVDVGCDINRCALDALREPKSCSGRLVGSTAMRRGEHSGRARAAPAEKA